MKCVLISTRYERLDYCNLPTLYIVYSNEASSSGKTHSSLKTRWQKNVGTIRQDMSDIADLAQQGR